MLQKQSELHRLRARECARGVASMRVRNAIIAAVTDRVPKAVPGRQAWVMSIVTLVGETFQRCGLQAHWSLIGPSMPSLTNTE